MSFGSFDTRPTPPAMTEINMVPLIDVMLVLLIIFMITAPLLTHSIKINVPQASTQPAAMEPDSIDLAVDAQGLVYWNGEPIMLEALRARFEREAGADPQPELRIRADRETRYEVLARIMGDARAAGITKLGFITRPDGPSGQTPIAK